MPCVSTWHQKSSSLLIGLTHSVIDHGHQPTFATRNVSQFDRISTQRQFGNAVWTVTLSQCSPVNWVGFHFWMYSRAPQIQLSSVVTAGLSKHGGFSHFMGGARGRIEQASTKSLCCRVFTAFSIFFSIGNALLDLPIKIWGVWNTVALIFFTQVFFFLRRFIKMSQHCIQLHLNAF